MKANARKYMGVLVVKGTFRKHIFAKSKSFEIYFYYTPIKKMIVDFVCEGITIKQLGLGQVIGKAIVEVESIMSEKGYSVFRIER